MQAVNETMKGVNEKYPVGGIILYAHNIEDEAAVGCIQAGVDIVLGPQNLVQAFDAVMAAVENSTQ